MVFIDSMTSSWRHWKYGGDDEYYIQVRETGSFQQEHVKGEHHEEITKDMLAGI